MDDDNVDNVCDDYEDGGDDGDHSLSGGLHSVDWAKLLLQQKTVSLTTRSRHGRMKKPSGQRGILPGGGSFSSSGALGGVQGWAAC